MTRAFIGLGSNLGDRLGHLRRALEALGENGVRVVAASSVYETDPIGPPQPDFLNAVCEAETDLAPADLVALLKGIEAGIGRRPGERWGPREIDLDLLMYGDEVVDEAGARVPHPELTRRAFVLVPLLEIAPGLALPSGEKVAAVADPEPKGVRLFAGPLHGP